MRTEILNKAMWCIDEVYPDQDTSNAPHFPIEEFLDQAAGMILRIAPLHALGEGESIKDTSVATSSEDGTGRIELPAFFCRLISFCMKGWLRPVTQPIRESDSLFKRQFNPLTRGGTAKPVVVLRYGDTVLDYYSLPDGAAHEIEELKVLTFEKVDDTFPPKLADATAWQVAGLVLSTMNDLRGAEVAQNRVTQLLASMI